ncbi:MAG TPA: outer membrane lipoprotein carrier protein LolA [Candidatus Acidoferrales bacterium]|nr:outer membrane lipoprotein carrier protein LolA [Candidatus Acidoferrales bacterium]
MNSGRRIACVLVLGTILVGAGAGQGPFLSSALATPQDAELASTLRAMENRYNRLRTLKLRFEQIYRQGGRQDGRQNRQVIRREEGTLFLRKPGQMRWQYEQPEPKLFLADGRSLTLYVPAENRATQMSLKEADDLRTPLAFLLGRLRFDDEFEHLERSSEFPPLERGNLVVKAVPKRMPDRVEWIVFEVSPNHEIRRLIFEEPGGIQTEFLFTDEETNPALALALFYFQPPAGTELIRQE